MNDLCLRLGYDYDVTSYGVSIWTPSKGHQTRLATIIWSYKWDEDYDYVYE